MSSIANRLVARLMDGLDLLIDFATLGEYGLEELPADGSGREKTGGAGIASLTPRGGASPADWEVLARARRSSPPVCGSATLRTRRPARESLV